MNETDKVLIQIQGQNQCQIQDQILVLLWRESRYISSWTITKNRLPPLPHIHNRSIVLKWFYTVVTAFHYDREVIPIAMDYLDRFLISDSIAKDISIRTYKLVAITSLYLATKINLGDISSRGKISLQECAFLSEGLLSPEDISSMERRVLDTLNWTVNPVSPLSFVRYFLKLMEPIHRQNVVNVISGDIASQDEIDEYISTNLIMETLESVALYFTELAICMPETTTYFHLDRGRRCSTDSHAFAASTIAYASILLSMEMISHSALPLVTRRSFLRKCAQLFIESHCLLHPEKKYVKDLQIGIQKTFTLDKKLNQAAALEGRAYHCVRKIHPLDRAIRYGILNSRFIEGIPLSNPTDLIDPFDSTNTSGKLNNDRMLSKQRTLSISSENSPIPVPTRKRKLSTYSLSPTSLIG